MKKIANQLTLLILAATLAFCVFHDVVARASDKEWDEITARAKDFTEALDPAPKYGVALIPREYWEQMAQTPSGRSAIATADKLLNEELPTITEELYKEYYRNGNRSNYQTVFGRAQSRVVGLALGEAFTNQGKYISALNEALDFFCSLNSWVLPAHDSNAKIYDGEVMYSDLGSTCAGGDVALVVNLLRDKLDPTIVEKATQCVQERVLQPYLNAVRNEKATGMWWVRTHNNWSAVCHCGTVAAALNLLDSAQERAFYLAGAEYFSTHGFLLGFTNDGYCSEGMGYWDYGFGYYIMLGALAYNATHGQLDLFRFEQIRPVLDFAMNMEIDSNCYATFADCSTAARPTPAYVGYVSRFKNLGYLEYEKRGLGANFPFGSLLRIASMGADRDFVFREMPENPERYKLPERSEFPDAGVLICRPNDAAQAQYFALALKGGNNAEMHNHNDVGSYLLLLGARGAKPTFICRDPGGEVYTQRTFSANRYQGQLLNSYGHPVPRINGVLQSPGVNSRGVLLEKSYSDQLDRYKLDIASAYQDDTLASLTREFRYYRATAEDAGKVEVIDSVQFKENQPGEFETAIITFEKIVIDSNEPQTGAILKIAGGTVRARATDAKGEPLELILEETLVGKDDASVPNKPTRMAFRLAEKVENATITVEFTVAK
ncbi:MAG: hypothetical protein Q4G03_05450 [Planctomycetia bacterium]|nr:hypothetical protein [Planctomycetia bacterium]